MRLYEFVSLHLSVDNPGGEWLIGKQEQCRQEGELNQVDIKNS